MRIGLFASVLIGILQSGEIANVNMGGQLPDASSVVRIVAVRRVQGVSLALCAAFVVVERPTNGRQASIASIRRQERKGQGWTERQ